MSPSRPEELARNRGLISAAEQARLGHATVLIAGVGGVGGRIAETLARAGIGHLRLTDPDIFTATNLNRQAGCTRSTLGRNKAEVLGELCREVGATPFVECSPDGLTDDNISALVTGADVVVDGTDYTQPSLGLDLARLARSLRIPVVLPVEVAFGAWVTTFLPDGKTFEQTFGLRRTTTSNAVTIALWRWIGALPPYADLSELRLLVAGEIEAPAVSPAVELSAGLAATAVIDILCGRIPPAVAPRVLRVDARTGRSSIGRNSRARFTASVARAVVTQALRRRR